MNKFAGLILFLSLFLPLNGIIAQDQRLYPVFTAADPFAPVAGIVPEEALPHDRTIAHPYYFKEHPYASTTWHPLMLYVYMYEFKADRHGLFYSPDIIFNKNNEKKEIISEKNDIFMILGSLSFICFIIILYSAYRTRKTGLSTLKLALLLAASLICFRWGTILLNQFLMGHVMLYPTDEKAYFKIATDILDGNFSGKWNMTLGLSLMYIPFILFTGARDYFDIVHLFSYFNAFVTGTLLIILIFAIIWKLSGSISKAYISSLLLCIIPLFYFPAEMQSDNIYKAVFALCHYTNTSFRTYYLLNWLSFNGMSDGIATVLLLISVFLCLYFKRLNIIFIVSAIFAFSCLVRINNILFAPLLAYLFWNILNISGKKSIPEILKSAFLCMIIFFCIFSPQLIVNKLMHGAFLRFPYVMHPNRAAEGFALDHVWQGINYLFSCNYIFFTAAAVFLLFMKKGFSKNVMVLWIVPLLIFFVGYPCLETNPVRFILSAYGALIAVSVLYCGSCGNLRDTIIFSSLMILNILCCAPVHRFELVMPFDMQISASWMLVNSILVYAVPIISIIICILFLKSNKTLIVFLIVYHIGNPYLVFLLFVYSLIVVLYDIFKEIKLLNTGVSSYGKNEA